ncbi:hypothetical protein HYU11_02060 [Candidatus Woesearchaeota archaeon]|nr:hypothetical protein [Candidatus Woesearchaeota archaeon]
MEGYKIMAGFFKEYDIRGLIGSELNAISAERIGKSVGTFIDGRDIIVCRDIRYSSKEIQPAFIKGLLSTGCNVTFIGEYPSPVLFFNSWKQGKEGAMITASHNPAEYTGFKFVEASGCSYVDQYRELERIYASGKFRAGNGKYMETDGYLPYEVFLKSVIKIKRKVKVAVECLHASSSVIIPGLYEKFGMDVLASHCIAKPDFNNERPEPKGDNLREMAESVVMENADFGVGFDGDCDRSVFIDDTGRELNGSMTAAVFIKHLLQSASRKNVVMTVDCNSELAQLAEALGGKLFWSEVGHGFIGKNVFSHGAVFGGEMSSHFWFEHYPFSDGFIAGLKMAELLSRSDKKLSEMVDEIKFAPMLKEYVDCGTHEKKEIVKNALVERYKKVKNATLTRDGIKFFLNEIEWVLLRKSNNLPEVCLVIEARDRKRLDELHSKYRKVIDDAIREI